MIKKAQLLLALVLCATFAQPAMAALGSRKDKDDKPAAKPIKPVTPAKETAVLPTITKTTTVDPNAFPTLPPSRPCTEKDLSGLFRLSNVYEDPQATETTTYRASPNQYIQFRKDNVFSRVNMDSENYSPKAIIRQLREHSTGLMQYIIQDNGFIYFYQNSVAVDVQACFIVANDKTPFKTGQLLMMPPKGQIQGKLAKVYDPMRPGQKPDDNNARGQTAKGKAKPKPKK